VNNSVSAQAAPAAQKTSQAGANAQQQPAQAPAPAPTPAQTATAPARQATQGVEQAQRRNSSGQLAVSQYQANQSLLQPSVSSTNISTTA
ncbi:hypothetical protein, partial [Chromobacterium phragmitis]